MHWGHNRMAYHGRYWAHSSDEGRPEELAEHWRRVSQRAAGFGAEFGCEQQARVAGLLHDLGKYGDLFQRRIRGEPIRVDHSSAGAVAALELYRQAGIPLALAVLGHHGGLGVASREALRGLSPQRLADPDRNPPVSEPILRVLLDRLAAEGGSLADPLPVPETPFLVDPPATSMIDVRMLFSALVDADFLATEEYYALTEGRRQRPDGPRFDPDRVWEQLQAYLQRLAGESHASSAVNSMRADLLSACVQGACEAPGLFTLTAPTGTGKTLSMLAFAVRHAIQHGLRRIVCVIPYLSIIEQTVRVYREALGEGMSPAALSRYVLEDHSLAGTQAHDECEARWDDEEEADRQLLAENWDAPIVVTTSVQFLESLFANRPAACRKLHNLAGGVILLDEVQTLPKRLAVPTLAALSRLTERYRCSVVLSTATQPAFRHLASGDAVRRFWPQGWGPREIVPDSLRLFERARRTRVRWPEEEKAQVPWADLAAQIAAHQQVLCIVNLKRHAWQLLDLLGDPQDPALFHLSTSMCPAHRRVALAEARHRLERGEPCRLVSTQCIEAGVDVDFPVVFRAWGPLEAIAQAAGRCNRNGREDYGEVHVFIPEEEDGRRAYPDATYMQAAQVASGFLRELGGEGMDLDNPELFERYYRRLYLLDDLERRYDCLRTNDDLVQAICALDFREVARRYRLIENDTINVLVPYEAQAFDVLAAEARNAGVTYDWILRARPHCVSLFRPRDGDAVVRHLEPLLLPNARDAAEDWFLYMTPEHYDQRRGLRPPQADKILIA